MVLSQKQLPGNQPVAINAESGKNTNEYDKLIHFWIDCWQLILGRSIKIPRLPKKYGSAYRLLNDLGFSMFFLPKITEADYPQSFAKTKWGEMGLDHEVEIQHCPLPGRWVAVESVGKPNWAESQSYGAGQDPLAQYLGLPSRFADSWQRIKRVHLFRLAKQLKVKAKFVRFPTIEEWNLIHNLFLWFNEKYQAGFPDLSETNSWEWCENSCGPQGKLIVGGRRNGVIPAVHGYWAHQGRMSIGWRSVVLL